MTVSPIHESLCFATYGCCHPCFYNKCSFNAHIISFWVWIENIFCVFVCVTICMSFCVYLCVCLCFSAYICVCARPTLSFCIGFRLKFLPFNPLFFLPSIPLFPFLFSSVLLSLSVLSLCQSVYYRGLGGGREGAGRGIEKWTCFGESRKRDLVWESKVGETREGKSGGFTAILY